jgi:NADH:ubiquinone oxidoreductase subunit 6 (subunit J)
VSWADAVFIGSSAVALGGAALAVLLRNIFHNILGFALGMLGVAGIFLSLGADFLAAVFVLVYVGAVAIAMVYAVMLSHPLDQPRRPRSATKVIGAAGLAAMTAGSLWALVRRAPWAAGTPAEHVTAAQIGARFLGDYVLAFELISVLLLVAMMGAVMVARRSRAGRGTW